MSSPQSGSSEPDGGSKTLNVLAAMTQPPKRALKPIRSATSFELLPFEVLVQIFEYFFWDSMSWEAQRSSDKFSMIVVSRSKQPGARYRPVGTAGLRQGQVWHDAESFGAKIYPPMRSPDYLSAIWPTEVIQAAADEAFCRHYTGLLRMSADGYWQWLGKSHHFYQHIAPRLPLRCTKQLTLYFPTGHLDREPDDCLGKHLTWRELSDFIGSEHWPVLEQVAFHTITMKPHNLNIRQIGGLLRGEHDQTLMRCWERQLPEVLPGDPGQIGLQKSKIHNGTNDHASHYKCDEGGQKPVVLKVYINDLVNIWIPEWPKRHDVSDHARLKFVLEGTNFSNLTIVSRRFENPNMSLNPRQDLDVMADGTDWEDVALARWPDLEEHLDPQMLGRVKCEGNWILYR